jgi:uncharacterized phage-like protein YoqJ
MLVLDGPIMAFTGHRPDKLGREYDYDGPYSNYLRSQFKHILLTRRPRQVISGMALGVDTLACQVALVLEIPVLASIPFEGQECRWPRKSQDLYNSLLADPLVTKLVVCEGSYNSAKMQIRNEHMVDNCDLLVSVWNGTTGGTMNCVRYAEKKKDLEIILINPEGWRKKEQPKQPGLF